MFSDPQPHLVDFPAIHRMQGLTVNIHKGFSAFNRRFILPELHKVVGEHERHSNRYNEWQQTSQYESAEAWTL
ncbi:hypothetical protein PS898_00768 [Pseudomonas fluorescens]|nr:hypothetical protein PS898_00768 [Pseudomonas fluorescens]